jgi:hypothetical protein
MPKIFLPNGKVVHTEKEIPESDMEGFISTMMGSEPSFPEINIFGPSVAEKRRMRAASEQTQSPKLQDPGGKWIDDPVLGKTWKSYSTKIDLENRPDSMMFDIDAPNIASHLPDWKIPNILNPANPTSPRRMAGTGLQILEDIFSDPTSVLTPGILKALGRLKPGPEILPANRNISGRLLNPAPERKQLLLGPANPIESGGSNLPYAIGNIEKPNPTLARFIAGEAGVAESRPHTIDIGHIPPSSEGATLHAGERSAINTVDPDIAARSLASQGVETHPVETIPATVNPIPEVLPADTRPLDFQTSSYAKVRAIQQAMMEARRTGDIPQLSQLEHELDDAMSQLPADDIRVLEDESKNPRSDYDVLGVRDPELAQRNVDQGYTGSPVKYDTARQKVYDEAWERLKDNPEKIRALNEIFGNEAADGIVVTRDPISPSNRLGFGERVDPELDKLGGNSETLPKLKPFGAEAQPAPSMLKSEAQTLYDKAYDDAIKNNDPATAKAIIDQMNDNAKKATRSVRVKTKEYAAPKDVKKGRVRGVRLVDPEAPVSSMMGDSGSSGRLNDPDAPMMGAVSGNQSTYPRPSRAANLTNPVEILWRKLSDARKLNKEGRIILQAERAERFKYAEQAPGKGSERIANILARLKGEYTKPMFEPLKLNPQTRESIIELISNTPGIAPYEEVRAAQALDKLNEGFIPQKNEIDLLNKLLSPHIPGRRPKGMLVGRLTKEGEQFSNLIADRFIPKTDKAYLATNDIMRKLRTSFDMSGLRQALPLATRKEFYFALKDMALSGASQEYYDTLVASIKANPAYKEWVDAGLAIGEHPHSERLNASTIISNAIGDLPGIKHSQRAYDGLLLKLRMETSEALFEKLKRVQGKEFNPAVARHYISKYVNTSTGVGDIKALGQLGEIFQHIMFAPKYTASRLEMLNPTFYINQPKGLRMEAWRNAFAMAGFTAAVNTVGYFAGGKLQGDFRSSDAGKVRFGKTRVDSGSGFLQPMVLAYRMLKGQTMSASDEHYGKLSNMDGSYGAPSKRDLLLRFLENKLAPMYGVTDKALQGYDFEGKPYNIPAEVAKSFVPLIMEDLYDLYMEEDMTRTQKAIVGAGDFFGLTSSQVYN